MISSADCRELLAEELDRPSQYVELGLMRPPELGAARLPFGRVGRAIDVDVVVFIAISRVCLAPRSPLRKARRAAPWFVPVQPGHCRGLWRVESTAADCGVRPDTVAQGERS